MTNQTDQVDVENAKDRLPELLARVERGEHIMIVRDGKPIARLVAVGAPAERELGFVSGGSISSRFMDELSDNELAGWDGE